jgi:hypothetical protein
MLEQDQVTRIRSVERSAAAAATVVELERRRDRAT